MAAYLHVLSSKQFTSKLLTRWSQIHSPAPIEDSLADVDGQRKYSVIMALISRVANADCERF